MIAERPFLKRQSTHLLLLVIILLTGFVLRTQRLGDKNVWWDEGLAVWAARQAPAAIAQWTASDVHPPLYFWMLHVWRQFSGDGEFGLRYLSAMIGVLTIGAVYQLGRTIAGKQVGLLAALLIAVSRFDLLWSQEMRMYALVALLAAIVLRAAIRFWDHQHRRDAFAYVLAMTAGLYTLYLFASVLLVVNLIWLWVCWRASDRRRTFIRWTLMQIVVLALFAPWLWYAISRIPSWTSSSAPVALDAFLRIYWSVLTLGIETSVENFLWLTMPALIVFIAGVATVAWSVRRDAQRARYLALLIAGLLLPAAVVYIVALPKDTFFYAPQLAPRYLLIFVPAYCVLMAWGIVRLGANRRWPIAIVAELIVLSVAAYGLFDYYPGIILADQYKSVSLTLRAYQRSADAVVLYTDTDWPIFAYHYPEHWWGVPHLRNMSEAGADFYLAPIWEQSDGVWLLITPYAEVSDPGAAIPAWLAAHAITQTEHRFDDKILRFYAKTQTRAATIDQLAPDARPAFTLESDLGLIGYDQPVREYRPGDTIHLFLYWDDVPNNGYTVSLIDDQHRVQSVDMPYMDEVRQQIDLRVPADVIGGTYTFAMRPLSSDGEFRFGRVGLRQDLSAALTPANVTITQPLHVEFADGVRLLGYDINTDEFHRAGRVYLTLYWQSRESIDGDYKVFTHLLGETFNAEDNNFLWGQQDNFPVNNTRATSTWRAGEVIIDTYAIPVHSAAPAGRYQIEIGMYDPATGDRLNVIDAADHSIADHVLLTDVLLREE